MCHLMGIVVQPNDGLPLLDPRQYYHKSSVGHHQIQVVLGEVKIHRLTTEEKRHLTFTITSTTFPAAKKASAHLKQHFVTLYIRIYCIVGSDAPNIRPPNMAKSAFLFYG